MNILVIHNFNNQEQSQEPLFTHLNYWVKSSANIWVLNTSNASNVGIIQGIHFEKLTRFIPSWISIYLWYIFSPHPTFDIVIDASKTLPCLTHKLTKLKTVYYFSSQRMKTLSYFKLFFTKPIFKFFFKDRFFLFSEQNFATNVISILKHIKIEGFVMGKQKPKTVFGNFHKNQVKMNLLYFDTEKQIDLKNPIFQIFTGIVRKNEGWKLTVFTDKKFNKNQEIDYNHPLYEYLSEIRIEPFLEGNLDIVSKIPKNSIVLLLLKNIVNSLFLVKILARSEIPFITTNKDNLVYLKELKNRNLVYTSGGIDEVIGKLVEMERSREILEKLILSEKKWANSFDATKPEEESLKFIESI